MNRHLMFLLSKINDYMTYGCVHTQLKSTQCKVLITYLHKRGKSCKIYGPREIAHSVGHLIFKKPTRGQSPIGFGPKTNKKICFVNVYKRSKRNIVSLFFYQIKGIFHYSFSIKLTLFSKN